MAIKWNQKLCIKNDVSGHAATYFAKNSGCRRNMKGVSITGALTGSITGALTGSITGALTGSITGALTGSFNGQLKKDVSGHAANYFAKNSGCLSHSTK